MIFDIIIQGVCTVAVSVYMHQLQKQGKEAKFLSEKNIYKSYEKESIGKFMPLINKCLKRLNMELSPKLKKLGCNGKFVCEYDEMWTIYYTDFEKYVKLIDSDDECLYDKFNDIIEKSFPKNIELIVEPEPDECLLAVARIYE